jgi:hypothetical protein
MPRQVSGQGRRGWVLLAALLVAAAGCVERGVDRILAINSSGALGGLVFLDRNGNLTQDAGEGPVQGIAVQVLPRGTRTPVARLVSSIAGTIGTGDLPVGDYDLVVETATIPDSLRLIQMTSSGAPLVVPTVRLIATDTADVRVVLSFPTVKVRDARSMAPSRRVFVEGVALNAWTTYGDSTLHVADSTGVMRVIRAAQSAVSAGQLVRVLGTTDARDGQGILTDATLIPVGTGQLPEPVLLTTSAASRADAGRRDAALAQVSSATILSGQTNVAGDFILTVTDGSGLLDIVIDRHTGISTTPYVPGASLVAVGLLVPSGQAALWHLKPRSALDLTVSFPTATIAQARLFEAGRVVSIEGIALNAWASFADSTVHMTDGTGLIRAVRVQPANIFAGDRVRMLGTIVYRDGQPTLSNVTSQILGTGVLPLAERLTTARASIADGGRLDAGLVRVIDALVGDTATIGGDLRLTVDDGTGPLEVLLDRDAGFQLGVLPGAIIDVSGLLVPLTSGTAWRLKPRGPSDFVQVGNARATIAQARTLPVGRVVLIEGVALNGWATFADSTVHVSDDTGYIRAVQVRPAAIQAGNRVRMLGTVAMRDGQPVISNVTPSVLGAGLLPLAPALPTGVAATAQGGQLDAALVRVTEAVILDITGTAGEFIMRVNDGTGVLEVLLDRDIGFQTVNFVQNRVLTITGVLVPIPPAQGGGWRLKPRQQSDIIVVR